MEKDRITVRLTLEEKKHIKKLAIEKDVTISELILFMVRKYTKEIEEN